jgi:hypothetical protein
MSKSAIWGEHACIASTLVGGLQYKVRNVAAAVTAFSRFSLLTCCTFAPAHPPVAAFRVHVLGSTLWRNRALQARRYEVVAVTAWEWDEAAGLGKVACEQLLLEKLGLPKEGVL